MTIEKIVFAFRLSVEFTTAYKKYREDIGDPKKKNYQVAVRNEDAGLAMYLKHIPSQQERRIKQFSL
jgi:hypothetical protein